MFYLTQPSISIGSCTKRFWHFSFAAKSFDGENSLYWKPVCRVHRKRFHVITSRILLSDCEIVCSGDWRQFRNSYHFSTLRYLLNKRNATCSLIDRWSLLYSDVEWQFLSPVQPRYNVERVAIVKCKIIKITLKQIESTKSAITREIKEMNKAEYKASKRYMQCKLTIIWQSKSNMAEKSQELASIHKSKFGEANVAFWFQDETDRDWVR